MIDMAIYLRTFHYFITTLCLLAFSLSRFLAFLNVDICHKNNQSAKKSAKSTDAPPLAPKHARRQPGSHGAITLRHLTPRRPSTSSRPGHPERQKIFNIEDADAIAHGPRVEGSAEDGA